MEWHGKIEREKLRDKVIKRSKRDASKARQGKAREANYSIYQLSAANRMIECELSAQIRLERWK